MAARSSIVAVVLVLLSASCSTIDLHEERARWRVVDATTKAGVPEAAVLVTHGGTAWAPGHSTTTCSRAYFAFTDSDGWVDLPGLTAKSEGRFYVYKRGLVSARPSFHFKLREIYVRAARDDPEERLTNLVHLRSSASCNQIGRNAQPIADFLSLVLSDIKPTMQTSEEAEVIRHIQVSRDLLTSIAQGKD